MNTGKDTLLLVCSRVSRLQRNRMWYGLQSSAVKAFYLNLHSFCITNKLQFSELWLSFAGGLPCALPFLGSLVVF